MCWIKKDISKRSIFGFVLGQVNIRLGQKK